MGFDTVANQKVRHHGVWLMICFFVVSVLGGCDSQSNKETEPAPPEDTSRGSIVSTTLIDTVTKAEIAVLGLPIVAQFDVELYRVVYRTVDAGGNETTASGALMSPMGATGQLPLVSYQHGTVVARDAVASVGGITVPEASIGIAFAATGYLAVLPDYLGLGSSSIRHPYVHAASLATSVLDMLRAAQRFAETDGIALSDKLFLIGYSEGGYATVAAQRLIESNFSQEFTVTASAPMAGNYDMSGVMATLMLSREVYPEPYYLPYTLLAYDDVYDLYSDPASVYVSPYDVSLPGLFDGTHTSSEIDAALPSIPLDILRSDYVDAVQADTNHPLWQALRDNDVYDWSPISPTRLYHCVNDDLVPYQNTVVAADRFRANGSTSVEVVSLDFGGHRDCAAPAILLGKIWFDSLRSGKRGAVPDLSQVHFDLLSRR